MKIIFGKVMWMGRATVFLVGLAVILAAVFAISSMAFAANGKPFILGRNNAASALTTLVKQGPGPALRLLARPGNPPMAVNSRVRVANLNADKVDGRDAGSFLSNETVTLVNQTGQIPSGNPGDIQVSCPTGEKAIGGGAAWIIPNLGDGDVPTSLNAPITASKPILGADTTNTGWRAAGRNESGNLSRILRVYAICTPR